MIYKLKSLDMNLSHWPAKVMLVRDGAPKKSAKSDKAELQAQIASHDYFSLLATRLDQVSQSLKETNHSDYVIRENTVGDLLYLQDDYLIVKK